MISTVKYVIQAFCLAFPRRIRYVCGDSDLCKRMEIDSSYEAEGVALDRTESNTEPCFENVGIASEMQVEEQKQER